MGGRAVTACPVTGPTDPRLPAEPWHQLGWPVSGRVEVMRTSGAANTQHPNIEVATITASLYFASNLGTNSLRFNPPICQTKRFPSSATCAARFAFST
jgi:hypothetical protein